jgi:orotate phosphoribosyltransferase-like protein
MVERIDGMRARGMTFAEIGVALNMSETNAWRIVTETPTRTDGSVYKPKRIMPDTAVNWDFSNDNFNV